MDCLLGSQPLVYDAMCNTREELAPRLGCSLAVREHGGPGRMHNVVLDMYKYVCMYVCNTYVCM